MHQVFYAEHDTDKIIREKFFPEYDYKGLIIEVGAATPTFISTTKHFKKNGWRAIHIEPNPRFVELHRSCGNEVYEFACSSEDKDNVDFVLVTTGGEITDSNISEHPYSSFDVKKEYQELNLGYFNSLSKTTITVNSRKLDTIIKDLNINKIDVLSIDTEGWEIEVMRGLSIVYPKLIILENLLQLESYNEYMKQRGYELVHKQEYNYFYEKKEQV